jgi:hypothetical protein
MLMQMSEDSHKKIVDAIDLLHHTPKQKEEIKQRLLCEPFYIDDIEFKPYMNLEKYSWIIDCLTFEN